MAKNKIYFVHPVTRARKEAPVGFSCTVALFGFFPPLFRGDWKWAIIMLTAALCTFGLSHLVFVFIYNKLYIKDLIGAGYEVVTVEKGTVADIVLKLGLTLPLAKESESKSEIDSIVALSEEGGKKINK